MTREVGRRSLVGGTARHWTGRLRFVVAPAILWALYALAIAGYAAVRSVGDQLLPWVDLEPVERAVFLGTVPPAWLQAHVYERDLVWLDFAGFALHFVWFWVPLAFGLLITLFERERLLEYLGWIVVASFTADIGFLLLPAEPPWMVDGAVRVLQVRSFVEYTALDNNPVAAFPSLHAGVPAVIALFLAVRCSRLRPLAWVAGVFSFAVGLAVVYLGEHWAIDVLAGWLLAPLTWYLFCGRYGLGCLNWLPGRPVERLRVLNRTLSSREPVEDGDLEQAEPVAA